MSKTKTYGIWCGMRDRTRNPNNPAWLSYGGRGILCCDRWKDFRNFLQDMGERPDGYSLDRIDPNGNYEPRNCRWATQIEQANNKRKDIHSYNWNGQPVSMNDVGLLFESTGALIYIWWRDAGKPANLALACQPFMDRISGYTAAAIPSPRPVGMKWSRDDVWHYLFDGETSG